MNDFLREFGKKPPAFFEKLYKGRDDAVKDHIKHYRNGKHRKTFYHRAFIGAEFPQNDANAHVKNVDVKGQILSKDLVVKSAARLEGGEKEQEKDAGEHGGKVHFHYNDLTFRNLQKEKEETKGQKEKLFSRLKAFSLQVLCKQIPQSEIGKTEDHGVSGIANGHVGVLQKAHIAAEKEIDRKKSGHEEIVPFFFFVFDKEKMHKGEHRQGNEKPKLVSAVGDGGVQVEEVKKEIVVKKGGKVIAYALAFGIAKKKVENDVEAKADYKIPKRSFKEALCLFKTKGVVAVVVEIAADHKKHGHGKSVKGEVGVCFSRKVNAYHKEGQKHLEQIKRETSFWNRHRKAPFCIF
jgi:hypothetical protein